MGEIKLKPCPFCGGEAKIRDNSVVAWIECGCGIETQGFTTIEMAINAWNTRKPMERIVENLEALKEQGIKFSSLSRPLMEIDHAIEIVKGGGVDETN